jgi:agmatine deiminase
MTSQTFLPAEWYEQDAILITWPHAHSAWKTIIIEVEHTYVDLVTSISHYQSVIIQTHESLDIESISKKLNQNGANVGNCLFVLMNSNDTWARDHGPITVLTHDKQPICLNFQFNGWGNKFASELDNQLNHSLQKHSVLPQVKDIEWVLEGGSIESDGLGTVLTTSECVLNPNRNGDHSKEELIEYFKQWFGCEKVIFLEYGALEGDDTDAHVDTLARFAPKNMIVFQGCDDPTDSHFKTLQAMKQELMESRNALDEPYILLELPMPTAKFSADGHRLPATYANFLITNKVILVPTYNDASDKKAMDIIQEAFPAHLVTGINALPLIEEHGSVHCITMQLPKGAINFLADFERPESIGY